MGVSKRGRTQWGWEREMGWRGYIGKDRAGPGDWCAVGTEGRAKDKEGKPDRRGGCAAPDRCKVFPGLHCVSKVLTHPGSGVPPQLSRGVGSERGSLLRICSSS